jgi:hypothetical protein
MNVLATGLGTAYNVLYLNGSDVETPPQFLTYQPLQFLRVYDAFTQ